ncbi:MAG TPA: hypothetical protein VHB30_02615, partial [Solirubrobacteraceae bacterium]|nr:hypothetical protein [Solirubrobacteraceae bacterium]
MSRTAAAAPAQTLAQLRQAVAELLAAERRLRSRDRPGHDGLTLAQLHAMMALAKRGEATAGELARAA